MTRGLPKILVLSGSTRSGSYNAKLAGAATKALSQMECEVTLISLGDYELPIYNGDLESEDGIPDNAIKLARLFASSDGIFIASPEYNSSVSPLLKNTLDWVSRVSKDENGPLVPYKNTVFCLGSASPGALGGNRGFIHLRAILVSVGALVISEQAGIAFANKAFDDNEALADERTAGFLQAALNSLVEKAGILALR